MSSEDVESILERIVIVVFICLFLVDLEGSWRSVWCLVGWLITWFGPYSAVGVCE